MKGVTWFWKANTNPWSSNEIEQWIPFPNIINRQIEQAYQGRQLEVVISEKYKIDLNRLLQIDILDFDRQRPVRRCSKTGDTLAYYRRERFNFAQPIQRSIADDTLNYGCSFVTDWFILFTKDYLNRKMKEVTWFWKANTNPWSSNEIEQWIPFPDIINRQIEQAYEDRQLEIVISEKYKIDLNRLLQIDILDFDRQRPVRRC
ncbi:unnamed protein product [Rotaria sordida]|uniref:WWE domain-containing protein n=1 Tax=Rotaria sordida TaxID=392033 RepID=A0A814K6J5_9BILA|nr:unnamed protein product [Rotaria sordida]